MKKKTSFYLIFGLLVISAFSASLIQNTSAATVFSITLLCPSTNPERVQWALIIESELPEIGIESNMDLTGWTPIISRTFGYPLGTYDYIPSYDEGGYDVLFMSYRWDLDMDPTGLYESSSIYPAGVNYYQYNNSEYDANKTLYDNAAIPIDRTNLAYNLQSILYEDLPVIPVLYPTDYYVYNDNLTGIDLLLLSLSDYKVTAWDDPIDHEINYSTPYQFFEFNTFRIENPYADMKWANPIYGSLFTHMQGSHYYDFEIANNFAYEIHSGGINITATLDSAAEFSDGSTVLPSDIEYTYELHMTPEVLSPFYGELTSMFSSNDSISIDGSDIAGGKVVFDVNQMLNFPESILSYGIIDKSEVEPLIATHGYDIFNDAPGTGNAGWSLVKSCGPMMLDSFNVSASKAHLIPNPYWHGDAVELTNLNFEYYSDKNTALANLVAGSLDLLDAEYSYIPDDLTGLVGITATKSKSLEHHEIGVNMRHPILGTGELTPAGTAEAGKYVRKAISHTIQRQLFVDTLMYGLADPATSPIPNGCVGYDNALVPYEYNLDTAKTYMEAAGYSLIVISEFSQGYLFLLGLLAVSSSLIFFIRKNRR